MDPDHESDLAFLAEIAFTPSDRLVQTYRPWQLLAAETTAATILARLRGQVDILGRPPRRSSAEQLLEAGGWLFGLASCVFTVWSVGIDGPSYLAAASMFASSGGFAVTIMQRDLVRNIEAERGVALLAVLDQITMMELAIERLGTLGSEPATDMPAEDASRPPDPPPAG